MSLTVCSFYKHMHTQWIIILRTVRDNLLLSTVSRVTQYFVFIEQYISFVFWPIYLFQVKIFSMLNIGGSFLASSGWPSGLRRCVQVAVYICRRGFESHFWQTFFNSEQAAVKLLTKHIIEIVTHCDLLEHISHPATKLGFVQTKKKKEIVLTHQKN